MIKVNIRSISGSNEVMVEPSVTTRSILQNEGIPFDGYLVSLGGNLLSGNMLDESLDSFVQDDTVTFLTVIEKLRNAADDSGDTETSVTPEADDTVAAVANRPIKIKYFEEGRVATVSIDMTFEGLKLVYKLDPDTLNARKNNSLVYTLRPDCTNPEGCIKALSGSFVNHDNVPMAKIVDVESLDDLLDVYGRELLFIEQIVVQAKEALAKIDASYNSLKDGIQRL